MNKFNVRFTTVEDYTELTDWWHWHRWGTPPSIELLDNLRFGLMVSSETENICAGFVYFTNASKFGLLEYVVSTYKVKDKQIRKEAKLFLIECLKELAHKNGVETLVSTVKNDSLINDYLQTGFVKGGSNYTLMIGKI